MPKKEVNKIQQNPLLQGKVVAVVVIIIAALFLITISSNSNSPEGAALFGIFSKNNKVPVAAIASDEVEGTVVVNVWDEGTIEHPRMDFMLEVEEGGKKKLYEIKDNPGVRGSLVGGQKTKFKKKDIENIAIAESSGGSTGKGTSEGTPTKGKFRTLVIMGNYRDSILPGEADQYYVDGLYATPEQFWEALFSPTWSYNPDQIGGLIESAAKGYYRYTNGQVDLYDGKVIGTPKIQKYSKNDAGCDYYGFASELNAYARSRGYEPNDYEKVTYVLPAKDGCPGGMGQMPGGNKLGNPGLAWIFSWKMTWPGDAYTAIHEWGHNFGMSHAAGGPPFPSNYDTSDAMCCGGNRKARFNAPHMWQMHLSDHKTQEVTNDGIYQIGALDYQDEHLRQTILKTDCSYFISYRHERNPKHDLNYGTKYQYSERVQVHTYEGWSSYACVDTRVRANLAVGDTYEDANCNLQVTFLSEDTLATNTRGATVSISLSGQPPTQTCIRNVPALSMSPDIDYAMPGGKGSYVATIQNKDSSICDQTIFTFTHTLDSGITGKFTPTSITLSPNEAGTVVFEATPSSSQPEGSYTVKIHSSSTQDPIHENSANSLLVVDGTSPSPVILTASPSRKYIDLFWTESNDNVGIDKYMIYRDNVIYRETSSTSFRDSNVQRGITYSYYIIPRDKAGNKGPQSNTVTASVGSGGGGKGGGDSSTPPQCKDGIDNDGDGFCDYAGWKPAKCTDGSQLGDSGCTHQNDNSE